MVGSPVGWAGESLGTFPAGPGDTGFRLGFPPARRARVLCREGPCCAVLGGWAGAGIGWVLAGGSSSPPSGCSKNTNLKPCQARSQERDPPLGGGLVMSTILAEKLNQLTVCPQALALLGNPWKRAATSRSCGKCQREQEPRVPRALRGCRYF